MQRPTNNIGTFTYMLGKPLNLVNGITLQAIERHPCTYAYGCGYYISHTVAGAAAAAAAAGAAACAAATAGCAVAAAAAGAAAVPAAAVVAGAVVGATITAAAGACVPV